MLPAEHNSTGGPILVVEDDDDTRDALCQLLKGQGYQPLAAAHGQEALRWLSRAEPTLIVTDLSMPVMSGWQLLEQLGSHPQWCRIPVIVLSADSPPPVENLCFLQKPVPAARLLAEIAAHVGRAATPVAKSPAA
jgi:CheY-like chemotaxis protein